MRKTCPKCGAELVRSEQLPTEKHRTYLFACGSCHDADGKFRPSWRCEQVASGRSGKIE